MHPLKNLVKTLGSFYRKMQVNKHIHSTHTSAYKFKCSETTNAISQTTTEEGERNCVSGSYNKIISTTKHRIYLQSLQPKQKG